MFSSKLPKQTLWEQSIQSQVDHPTWEDFNAFLVKRYRTLERIEDVSLSGSSQIQSKPSRREPIFKRVNSFEPKVNPKLQTCKLCSKENHPIRLCRKFVEMTVNKRSSTIKQHKLCLNCFARGHQLKDCTSAHNCHTFKGRHNTASSSFGPIFITLLFQSTAGKSLKLFFCGHAQSSSWNSCYSFVPQGL